MRVIDVFGPMSAGKTTLCSLIREAADDEGLEAIGFEDILAVAHRLPGKTLRCLATELYLLCGTSLLANRGFWSALRGVWTVRRTHKVALTRGLIRKLGAYRWAARRSHAPASILVLDEGIGQLVQNAVSPRGTFVPILRHRDLADLIRIGVYVTVDSAELLRRSRRRRDASRRLTNCADADLTAVFASARDEFESLCELLKRKDRGQLWVCCDPASPEEMRRRIPAWLWEPRCWH